MQDYRDHDSFLSSFLSHINREGRGQAYISKDSPVCFPFILLSPWYHGHPSPRTKTAAGLDTKAQSVLAKPDFPLQRLDKTRRGEEEESDSWSPDKRSEGT